MNHSNEDIALLIEAAQRVRGVWQAECDKHPKRKQSWEDKMCFYKLAHVLRAFDVADASERAAQMTGEHLNRITQKYVRQLAAQCQRHSAPPEIQVNGTQARGEPAFYHVECRQRGGTYDTCSCAVGGSHSRKVIENRADAVADGWRARASSPTGADNE